jgi:hypothetical protein
LDRLPREQRLHKKGDDALQRRKEGRGLLTVAVEGSFATAKRHDQLGNGRCNTVAE